MNRSPRSTLILATAKKITARLHDRLEGEKVSADQLAGELDVSRATIHRALRWLRRALNAPLEFDRVEGWKIDLAWHPILELPSPEEVATMRTLSALATEGAWGALAASTLERIATELELKLAESIAQPEVAGDG
jgi:predicted DNA-binding transcriptional regulator YafY